MSEIVLSDLTTGSLTGTGVFDALMRAAKVHLEDQYDRERIKGTEYATVYLGQMEAAMQSALSFLASREKIGLEADILREQRLLIIAQREQAEAQTKLVQEQERNAVLEGKVLIAQECKLRAEYNYTVKNTEKTAAETTLLAQRTATEKAQILGLGVDDDSVIGRQKTLYLAQTDGFKRDAEQKVAKLYVDVWSAQRMTDEGKQANPTNGLDDATMGGVMTKLRQGVGI